MKTNKFLMIAAVAATLVSCGGGGGRPNFGDNEYPVMTVDTRSASMQSSYPATIKGVQDVQISPKISGFITKINTLGLQAELTVNLRHSAFNISYCYLNQQKDVNEFLQSRYSLEYLRHKLAARWTLQLPAQLKLVLSARYHHRTGSYTDTQGNVCQYDPYVVFDSRLQWDRENYVLFLEALNLSAIRYVDYGNVPQPGLWINGGVKISF